MQDYDTIYVYRGTGSVVGLDNGVTLSKKGVQLIGSGSFLVYNGSKVTSSITGAGADVLIAGSVAPLLTSTTSGIAAVTMTSENNLVSGVQIENPAWFGLYANNAKNVTIENVGVAGSGNNSIHIESSLGASSGSVTARNLTIQNSTGYGIMITATGTNSGYTDVSLVNSVVTGSVWSNANLLTYSGANVGSFVVDNVVSSGSSSYGIYSYISASSLGRLQITNSQTNNNYMGVRIRSVSNGTIGELVMDTITANSNNYGVYSSFSLAAEASRLVNMTNITATGNIWRGLNFSIGGSRASSIRLENIVAQGGDTGVSLGLNSGADAIEITNVTVGDSDTGLELGSYGAVGNFQVSDIRTNNTSDYGIRSYFAHSVDSLSFRDVELNNVAIYGFFFAADTPNARIGTLSQTNVTSNNSYAAGNSTIVNSGAVIDNIVYQNVSHAGSGGVSGAAVDLRVTGIGSSIGTVALSQISALASTGTYGQGLRVTADSGGSMGSVTVSEVTVSNNTQQGVLIQSATNGDIGSVALNNVTSTSNGNAGVQIQATGTGSTIGDYSLSGIVSRTNTGTYGRGVYISADMQGQVGNGFFDGIEATNNVQQGLYATATAVGTMGTLTMQNLTSSGNGSAGLQIQATASGSTIGDVSVSDSLLQTSTGTNGRGAYITADTRGRIGNVTLANVTASGNAQQGAYLYATGTAQMGAVNVTGGTYANNAAQGFYAHNAAASSFGAITLENATARVNGNAGFSLLSTGTGTTFGDVAMTNLLAASNTGTYGRGVYVAAEVNAQMGSVDLLNMTASGNAQQGMYLYTTSSGVMGPVDVQGGLANNNANVGLYLYAASRSTFGDVTMDSFTAQSNGNAGITLFATGTGTTFGDVTFSNILSTTNTGNYGRGLYVGAETRAFMGNVSLSNVTATGNGQTAVHLYATTTGTMGSVDMQNIVTRNNNGSGVGVWASGAGGSVGALTINGLESSANAGAGVSIGASGASASLASVSLSDLVFQSNTGTSGRGLYLSADTFGQIGDVSVLRMTASGNSQYGAYVYMTSTRQLSSFSMQDSIMTRNAGTGFYTQAAAGTTIGDIVVSSSTSSFNTGGGFNVYANGAGATINNASLDDFSAHNNTSVGVYVNAAAAGLIDTATLSNIRSSSSANYGIEVYTTGIGSRINAAHLSDIVSTTNTGSSGFGVAIYATSTSSIGTATLSNVTASGNTQQGVYLVSGVGSTITSLTASGLTATGNTQTGVLLYATGTGSRIVDASLTNLVTQSNTGGNGRGLYVYAYNGGLMDNVNISGVNASNNAQNGVNISASAGQITAVSLDDVVANQNGGSGVILYATGTGASIGTATFSDLMASTNTGRGIYAYTDTRGVIDTLTIDTATMTNNTMQGTYLSVTSTGKINTATIDNLTTESNAYAGVQVGASGSGSAIGDVAFHNLVARTNTGTYGHGAYFTAATLGAIGSILVDGATASSNSQNGISVSAASAGTIGPVTVQNASTNSNANAGILLSSTASNTKMGLVTLNTIESSNNTGANGRGLYANATYNADIAGISVSNFTATGNAANGVYFDDDTAGAFVVDMGGGTLGSTANNRFFGNTGTEIRLDLDGGILRAQSNWWGTAAGLLPAEYTLEVGSTIDSTNHLSADPTP
jgi:predicted RNA-binding protein YlxR (DUF448 family)